MEFFFFFVMVPLHRHTLWPSRKYSIMETEKKNYDSQMNVNIRTRTLCNNFLVVGNTAGKKEKLNHFRWPTFHWRPSQSTYSFLVLILMCGVDRDGEHTTRHKINHERTRAHAVCYIDFMRFILTIYWILTLFCKFQCRKTYFSLYYL